MSRKLPVYMSDGQNTATTGADIVGASADDVKRYSNARTTTCVQCRHWNLEAGQNAMKAQRFVERLVIEEGWKARHLGAPPSTFGLCGMSGGERISSAYSQSCDQFAPAKGRMRWDGEW